MDNKVSKEIIYRFTLSTFLFGIIFLIIYIFIALNSNNLLISIDNIIQLHKTTKFFWLIDLVPIIFPLATYFISILMSKKIARIENELSKEEKKSDKILDFTKKITQNDFTAEYEISDKNDIIEKSLIELRNNIKQNKEEEILRKKEDAQLNWVAEGQAKFGEILRQNNDNIEKLSFEIISNLCKYIDAIQGAFYILEDSDKNDVHFEQTAFYAYNRKKYSKKRIDWNEGLVGRSAFEKLTIYMDKVPENYVEVTSGLGKSNPKSILIVPLKVNEEIHGVIEFGSFNFFDEYQIKFVEKVAESIASTISTVKINVKTAKLLEDSQEQAERLAQQEEEMRQNMEELQATQEEATKQSQEFVSFTNSVNHTLIRAEFDINGILLYANTKFISKLGYSANSDVEGHHISMFINKKDKEWFNRIWEELSKGGKHFEGYMKHLTKQGKDLWTVSTYTCIKDENGNVEKISFLAIDITEQKKQSIDSEGQIKAMSISTIKAEYSPTGEFIDCNEKFSKLTGHSINDLQGSNIFDLINPKSRNNFEENWNNVVKGSFYEGEIKILTKDKSDKWIKFTLAGVNDLYGDISKLIIIAYDITEQKEIFFENKHTTEQLIAQEEQLRQAETILNKKLIQAKDEVKEQYRKIEKIKIRNEKTLEGSLDPIVMISSNGNIEFFNKAAEQLWKLKRKDVINKNINHLFSDDLIISDNFINCLIDPEKEKIVGHRTEIKITTGENTDIPVLILLSQAKVDKEYTYTAFIQTIEVELF
ncbi:MAG: PAS domain S-box protein [Bacteroidales bacterium]|nr:PAS domain S-box protein [Bacteroidales bacterium]